MIKKLLARLLPPKNHFHGGLHITPPRHKSMSTGTPSRAAALSAEYAISLRQRDGSAYLAKVAPGERVLRGQLLAEPVNSQDAPVHAPTSGTIRAIEPRPEMHPANQPVPHLILESDGKDEAVPPLPTLAPETTDADTLRERIAACGIVGLGGAGFPTARKLGHPANTLVINAAECEPYITCDDLQIRENAADIIHGAQIAAKILGAAHIHFGIEDDKPQAIAALERAAADIADPRIKISSVPTRYPSGNARQLFELLLGVRVPADKHASDYGLICHNSGTMKAVYDAVIRGEPLTERYTTISGEGVKQPQVLRIRTGAPARDLIAQAGGEKGDNRYIIGGPMMGYQIISADTPLQKTGNSLLLLPAIEPAEESPCIRCSRCADACPMELLPQQLLWYSQSDEHKRLKQYRLFDCIECGICAAVCPSAIPLVQYYRHSKGAIRAADDKTRAAEHARARHEARTARLEREAAERQAQMDARRAKLQQNPAADKPERYTPAKETTASPADITPPSTGEEQEWSSPTNRAAASPNIQPPPPVGEGWGGGSQQNSAASDDKTTAIEAAKARAAARRAERLAAQNCEAETLTAPASPTEVLPPSQDALASAAGEGWGGGSVHDSAAAAASPNDTAPAPHQLPPDNDKTAAIEAAKARAAARKAARLAQQSQNHNTPPQNPLTPPHPSPTGGGSAPVAETATAVESPTAPPLTLWERGWGEGEKKGNNEPVAPHQLPPDDDKTASIEAAKARAAARKAARLAAQNEKAETSTAPASPTEPPPLPVGEGWDEGSKHSSAASEPETPTPHQLPPDDKTAATEAAKARAVARKAARLAQQSQNHNTPPQNPLTPPHPSPTGGGSAPVAETAAAAESPTGPPLPPQRSAAGEGRDGGNVRDSGTNVETPTNLPLPPMGEDWGGSQSDSPLPLRGRGSPANLVAESPADDKIAAIEAAKARAAARKAARIAAQNSEAETSTAPASPTEVLPPSQDALASAAGEGWGGGSALHSGTNAETSNNDKTTAIEAAKARAAARKATRIAAQNSEAETPTAPASPTEVLPPSQDALASAAGEGWGGGSVLHSGTNAETSTNVKPTPHPENNKQPEASPMTDDPAKQSRDAKLAAARAKSEERRIAHAKLKQHMRDTAIPIRPQPDDRK